MHAMEILRQTLTRSGCVLHKRRLHGLLQAVQAALAARSHTLSNLARALTGHTSVRHRVKCMDRLLGNTALQQLILAQRPAVVSFHFGLPEPDFLAALKAYGCITLACATDLDEALAIEQAGIDVVIAQGVEAGGHRGVFDPARDQMLGTLALVQLLVQRTRLPVVAAGGIMDGAGIAAVLQLGACAAQMGTAFVPCPESNANAAYRQALLNKEHTRTAVTSAISGRPARGLVNRLHALGAAYPGSLPAYPQVYDAGKALHQAASAQGCTDFAPFWAGQGVALARALPAAQLVQVLAAELAQAQPRGG